jgi:hypothetical protein
VLPWRLRVALLSAALFGVMFLLLVVGTQALG